MILDVALCLDSSIRSLVLDDTIHDDALTCISNWIRDSRILNNLRIDLRNCQSQSVNTFFFESLATSKSLVDISVSMLDLDDNGYMTVCGFISRTNAIVVKFDSIMWNQSFDLTRLFRSLAQNETIYDFTIYPDTEENIIAVQFDPPSLKDLLKSRSRPGEFRILKFDILPIVPLAEITEALQDNYTLVDFNCYNQEIRSCPQIRQNRDYNHSAARNEAIHAMNNARLLASARPSSRCGYRIPYELIEHILIYSNTTEKYWLRDHLRLIVRVLSSRESVGKIENYELEFNAHSLYYVCQKWALLKV